MFHIVNRKSRLPFTVEIVTVSPPGTKCSEAVCKLLNKYRSHFVSVNFVRLDN